MISEGKFQAMLFRRAELDAEIERLTKERCDLVQRINFANAERQVAAKPECLQQAMSALFRQSADKCSTRYDD